MENQKILLTVFALSCTAGLTIQSTHSQDKAVAAPTNAQVHMVITKQTLDDSSENPTLDIENIEVKQGKEPLKVDHLIPAKAENAGLQLMILIDETSDSRMGSNLDELRDFINAQPPSTLVGVAYASNASFQIAENFTADHALAAKAVRLPRGTLSSMDSPYLSLISLIKGWPEQKIRREVLIFTDGIDRLHGQRSMAAPFPGVTRSPGLPPESRSTMPSMSPNADSASALGQQSGVIVHSIYVKGVGRVGRNVWEVNLGQSGIAKIADETGGEYFALGLQTPVSFKPYLERLQRILENQYSVFFRAVPGKKAGLQRVDFSTTDPNSDIAAADSVWVPAGS